MLFAQGKDGFGEYMKGNQGKKYMNDSPVEWSKIQSYRSGGPRPCLGPKPCVTSFTGQGFVHFVAAYKTVPLPDPLWRRDIVYISDLTSFEHTRRAAARAQGFSVLCILADGAVDPNGYRNLNELSLIRNSLLNEGWAITGWASTDDIPELSAARAAQIVRDNGLSG